MDKYKALLVESGLQVGSRFGGLSEATKVSVTDEALTKMMKFITDKYNAIDFEEIEKSTGDITRFKYINMIRENLEMLRNIYTQTADTGAEKYINVVQSCNTVITYLADDKARISELYRLGNGMIQIMYTSLVAGILYAVGVLVSNTIRFVTTENNTPCSVLYDEIPGTIKHVHIRNVVTASKNIDTIRKTVDELHKGYKNKTIVNESVAVTALMIGIGVIAGIKLIGVLINLIREIIYSIYYTRIKVSDMIDLQVKLIRTNIESLEAGRGNKQVIARQRKIADSLEVWKNRIAVKIDAADTNTTRAIAIENKELDVDNDSILASGDSSSSVLI